MRHGRSFSVFQIKISSSVSKMLSIGSSGLSSSALISSERGFLALADAGQLAVEKLTMIGSLVSVRRWKMSVIVFFIELFLAW